MLRKVLAKKPTSGFPVVNQISDAIEAQPYRDQALNDTEARIIVTSAAEENGFFDVWTPEGRAVWAALRRLNCGPRSAHYGWRLYKSYRHGGQVDTETVTY